VEPPARDDVLGRDEDDLTRLRADRRLTNRDLEVLPSVARVVDVLPLTDDRPAPLADAEEDTEGVQAEQSAHRADRVERRQDCRDERAGHRTVVGVTHASNA